MDRYLFKGKEKDNGKWLEWNAIAGIPHNVAILTNTICQYTGLKDKNGKPIWEGDILHNGNYFVVKWNAPCARFDIVLHNSINIPIGKWEPIICDWKTNDFKEYRKAVDYEIIGNIFDNPELLNRDTIRTYCKDSNDYER